MGGPEGDDINELIRSTNAAIDFSKEKDVFSSREYNTLKKVRKNYYSDRGKWLDFYKNYEKLPVERRVEDISFDMMSNLKIKVVDSASTFLNEADKLIRQLHTQALFDFTQAYDTNIQLSGSSGTIGEHGASQDS